MGGANREYFVLDNAHISYIFGCVIQKRKTKRGKCRNFYYHKDGVNFVNAFKNDDLLSKVNKNFVVGLFTFFHSFNFILKSEKYMILVWKFFIKNGKMIKEYQHSTSKNKYFIEVVRTKGEEIRKEFFRT